MFLNYDVRVFSYDVCVCVFLGGDSAGHDVCACIVCFLLFGCLRVSMMFVCVVLLLTMMFVCVACSLESMAFVCVFVFT